MTQPPLTYPHPGGLKLHRPPPTDLHLTLGLRPANYALDFMAPGGTPIYAPQDSHVVRLSGHDPRLGEIRDPVTGKPLSVFGWSTYLLTSGLVLYYLTHQGDRTVKVGQKVRKGQLIGHVGHWPNDPPRSHSHLGVTHPMGKTAAVARINAVAKAPMQLLPL